jgi:amino acid permease
VTLELLCVKEALLSSSLFTMIPMKLMKDRIEKGGGFVTTFPVTIFSCVAHFVIVVVNNKMQLPYYVIWFVCR